MQDIILRGSGQSLPAHRANEAIHWALGSGARNKFTTRWKHAVVIFPSAAFSQNATQLDMVGFGLMHWRELCFDTNIGNSINSSLQSD